MPNHYTSKLIFDNDIDTQKIDAILPNICKGLMPMPQLLNHSASGSKTFTVDGIDITLRSWYTEDPDDFFNSAERPFTEAEMQELERIGFDNWYDWAVSNWGTKWGTYDVEYHDNILTFTSAWNAPSNNILQLLANYLDNGFTIEGTDEFEDEPSYSERFESHVSNDDEEPVEATFEIPLVGE